MKKIAIIAGTRPEIIKVASVLEGLKQDSNLEAILISTGQHSDLLETALTDFSIQPDVNLRVMLRNQTLSLLSSNILSAIDTVLKIESPDFVLVQGDTTSAFIGALSAFYRKIPVGHIEAGLRTNSKLEPFPEELNRRLITQIADLHFAPTKEAARALENSGIPPELIFMTGNTGIDALYQTVEKLRKSPNSVNSELRDLLDFQEYILVTCHRRESFGDPLHNICAAIKQLARLYAEINFIFPVHPNPNVGITVQELLGGLSNVHLIKPLPYQDFVYALTGAKLVITDSGGVQEEAPSLGKHVVVLRNETERNEAIDDGFAKIVGTDQQQIVTVTGEIIGKLKIGEFNLASKAFGDGNASSRIIKELKRYLNV